MARTLAIVLVLFVTGCSTAEVTQWSARIGPAGGTLVGDGISVTVPTGALDRIEEIRITRTDDAPPAGWTALSPVFRFEPAGRTFAQPLQVRFRTTRSDPAERVVWLSGVGATLEELAAVRAGPELITSVLHFSGGFAGSPIAPEVDGGPFDAEVAPPGPDLGVVELGLPDLGEPDLGVVDPDLGEADLGAVDLGVADLGLPDLSLPDMASGAHTA